MFKIYRPLHDRASLGCPRTTLKRGQSISQITAYGIDCAYCHRMHWLSSSYRTIFTRAMFRPKIKLTFFPARKAIDACRQVVTLVLLNTKQIIFFHPWVNLPTGRTWGTYPPYFGGIIFFTKTTYWWLRSLQYYGMHRSDDNQDFILSSGLIVNMRWARGVLCSAACFWGRMVP